MISWGQLCNWSYMVMKCLVVVDDLDSVFSSYIKLFLELRLLYPLKMLLWGVLLALFKEHNINNIRDVLFTFFFALVRFEIFIVFDTWAI